jgi:hypothetical protein
VAAFCHCGFLEFTQSLTTFMTLVKQARSIQADHSAQKYNVEHYLCLLEMDGDQKDVEAVREEFREADKALHEALVMIDGLKALVVELSPPVVSGERACCTSGCESTEDISSDHPSY